MCCFLFLAATHALAQYKVAGYPYEAEGDGPSYELRGRVHERVDALMRTSADSKAVKDRAGFSEPGREGNPGARQPLGVMSRHDVPLRVRRGGVRGERAPQTREQCFGGLQKKSRRHQKVEKKSAKNLVFHAKSRAQLDARWQPRI